MGPRFTASATSIGEPSGMPGGLATVNSPRTSTGWALGRVDEHRAPVGVLQEQLPVVRGLGLVPIDLELERDRRGHRVGTGDAPAASKDVELAVGHLRRVAEQHGHVHGGRGYRPPASPGSACETPVVCARPARPIARWCIRWPAPWLSSRGSATTSTGGRSPPRSNAWASNRVALRGRGRGRRRRVGRAGRGRRPFRAGVRGRLRPAARDEVARAAAAHSQVIAITQAGEELTLPEPVDLAFCRFLLLHVFDPSVVLRKMAEAVRAGGWVVAQEPITSAGRIDGQPMSCPTPAIPTSARCSRRSFATPGSSSSTPGPRRRPAWGPARSTRLPRGPDRRRPR